MDWCGGWQYNKPRAGWDLTLIPPRDPRDAPLPRLIPLLIFANE